MIMMQVSNIQLLNSSAAQNEENVQAPQVQSNYYLVHAGFDMHEMSGRVNPVQRLRSVARNRNNWHSKETQFKWKMDDRVRQDALSKCGVNE